MSDESCFYFWKGAYRRYQNFMFPVGHGWAEIIVPLSPFEITTSQILCGGLENVTRTQNFWRG